MNKSILDILYLLLPIIIGSLIGYFTNFVAIKMLFRPRKAYYIGKFRLPFTPGVIPKNKARLAESIANVVSTKLLSGDDIGLALASADLKQTFVNSLSDKIYNSEESVSSLLGDKKEDAVNTISDYLNKLILNGIKDIDLQPIIRNMVKSALSSYLSNPMLAMFLNESMLEGIYVKAEDAIRKYLDNEGEELIASFLKKNISNLSDKPINVLMSDMNISKDSVDNLCSLLFDKAVVGYGSSFIKNIDIKKIVSDKINAMDVLELEKMVFSVMKHELQAVINLGALIGAVIALVNFVI